MTTSPASNLNSTVREEANNALSTYLSSIILERDDEAVSAMAHLPAADADRRHLRMNFEHARACLVVGLFRRPAFMGIAMVIAFWWFLTNGWIKLNRDPEHAPIRRRPERATEGLGAAIMGEDRHEPMRKRFQGFLFAMTQLGRDGKKVIVLRRRQWTLVAE
jgi:hypothetical protein